MGLRSQRANFVDPDSMGHYRSMNNAAEASPDYMSVRAIALDTNVFRSAPGIAALISLAERADTHGRVEIWIADTVIWEWGQHLHEAHLAFRAAAKKLKGAGLLVSEPKDLSARDIASQLQEKIHSLGQSVRIIDTSLFAHEALRDQILLEGPGKRKGDVKTGAADSAHLRAYYAQAQENGVGYVLVSDDGDAQIAHDSWGHDRSPTIIRRLNRAAEAVFDSVPSDAHGVRRALSVAHDSSALLKDVAIGRADLGYTLDHEPEDGLSIDVDPTTARLVGLQGVKQDSTAVTFTALYLADVRVVGAAFNWRSTPQEVIVANALLTVDVSVSEDPDSPEAKVTNCEMKAPTVGPWTEPRDALDSIWKALSLLPCEVSPLTPEGWPGAEELALLSKVNVDIAGEDLELNLLGSGFHPWELTCTYRGHRHKLVCYEAGQGSAEAEYGTVTLHYYDIANLGEGPEWSENGQYGLNEFILGVGIKGLSSDTFAKGSA